MRLLLDTHIFIWLMANDLRLPAPMLQAIRDPTNEVFLSVVSLWEVIVKYQLGKMPLPESPEALLPRERAYHRIANLDMDEGSVARLISLPPIHRDPFDRMLICQAIHHQLTVVTVDTDIPKYPIPIL